MSAKVRADWPNSHVVRLWCKPKTSLRALLESKAPSVPDQMSHLPLIGQARRFNLRRLTRQGPEPAAKDHCLGGRGRAPGQSVWCANPISATLLGNAAPKKSKRTAAAKQTAPTPVVNPSTGPSQRWRAEPGRRPAVHQVHKFDLLGSGGQSTPASAESICSDRAVLQTRRPCRFVTVRCSTGISEHNGSFSNAW